MRADVDVHHLLRAAPTQVGAQAWPYTPRGPAALAAEPGLHEAIHSLSLLRSA
jgi:hypothetical protein